MSDTIETPPARTPERSRAIFSQEDFELIRTAITHYLRDTEDRPELVKFSNLYHRLGRAG